MTGISQAIGTVKVLATNSTWTWVRALHRQEMLTAKPVPVEFLVRRAEDLVEEYGGPEAPRPHDPNKLRASARTELEQAAALWIAEDSQQQSAADTATEAAAIAFLVARMTGTDPGRAPRPPQTLATGESLPVAVRVLTITKRAEALFVRIMEVCPCCGELGDQCANRDVE